MYADRKIGASHETYVFVIDAIVDHVITFFSRQLRRFCCSRSFVNIFLLIDRYVVILFCHFVWIVGLTNKGSALTSSRERRTLGGGRKAQRISRLDFLTELVTLIPL